MNKINKNDKNPKESNSKDYWQLKLTGCWKAKFAFDSTGDVIVIRLVSTFQMKSSRFSLINEEYLLNYKLYLSVGIFFPFGFSKGTLTIHDFLKIENG